MKHLFIILLLAVMYSTITPGASAATVSQQQALQLTKDQFKNIDADYYLLENDDNLNWTIFVDAAPLCGWEHDCYTITVPKQNLTNDLTPSFTKKHFSLPPIGNYSPLEVKKRVGSNSASNSALEIVSTDPTPNPYANKTYAIILSGGHSPMINYERYWNDCSYIYQVLSKQYHIPKSNIFPLMADGNDPSPDTNTGTLPYVSQDLDLDGDGNSEIELAATKENITNVITQIRQVIKKDEQFFLFVIDHGTQYRESGKTGSAICLWNQQTLKDYELVNLLKPLVDAKVNVNVMLGQCYSGGFLDPLANIGCVVATACAADEGSWAMERKDYIYDEFVYFWTKGIQKNGLIYNADSDNDKQVSMKECFTYAAANDEADETPLYKCNHTYLGEDLAFNYIPESVNLYIPDNKEDKAREPNSSTDIFWESPSIIVTEGLSSSNPTDMYDDYGGTGGLREIYVNVINRGKEDYSQGKKVFLYWTKAGIATNPMQWLGADNDGYGPVGGLIGQTVINDIPAGTSKLVKFTWEVPTYLNAQSNGIQSIDYLATIMDSSSSSPVFSGTSLVKVLENKNFAQKSVSKFSKGNYSKSIAMDCYIPDPRSSYSLEIRPKNLTGAKIMNQQCLTVQMNGKTYISTPVGNSDDLVVDYGKVFMKITDASQGPVVFKFSKASFEPTETTANFIIYLNDAKGNIVAGHSLQITPPNQGSIIELQSTLLEPGVYEIEATAPMLSDYEWTNQNGEEIGNDSSLLVLQSTNSETYHLTATDENGDICQGEVTIDKVSFIKSVDVGKGEVTINFNSAAHVGDAISIYGLAESVPVYDYTINEETEKITISIAHFSPGLYILSYTSRLGIKEVSKFEIK